MSFGISVKGGTGAGRKKPLRDKSPSWMCKCFPPDHHRLKPGYLVRCTDCGAERDGGR